MSTPLPSRSLFDKSSLQDVINRYGWSKNEPALPPGPGLSSPRPPAGKEETQSPPESVLPAKVFQVPPEPVPVPVVDPKLKEEWEAALKNNQELLAELAEKDERIDIVSRQCEELKERGDEFEKAAFEGNAEILKLKKMLEEKESRLSDEGKRVLALQEEISSGFQKSKDTENVRLDLEEKFKEEEGKYQQEITLLLGQMEDLKAQLLVDGVPVHDQLSKYRQQAKQGAELLKQSLAEDQRLESEVKALKGQVAELTEENLRLNEKVLLPQEPTPVPKEILERIQKLEGENGLLQKRLQDAEAQAINSQAAVSHAMDFAYKATQDNELMKKKLHEAGIRM